MTDADLDFIDRDRYPLDQPQSARYAELVRRCKDELARDGMFNLDGLMPAETAAAASRSLLPRLERDGYLHRQRHNIYFLKDAPGVDADHPALRTFETVNRKLCADQIDGGPVMRLYAYAPLIAFLADVMAKPRLYAMADPLAAVNVMAYRDGETLNWHFDRSEFTTTLLLQAPEAGGAFEYRQDLRSEDDPNYEGVARLLDGRDPEVRRLTPTPGALNVFRGKNTAHRVAPVAGSRDRLIAVFSYYERPGVMFSEEDRLRFYGRAG